jgi:hypothetical protein
MTKGNLGINRDNGECPHARFYSTEVTKSFIAFEFRDVTGAAYQIYVVNCRHHYHESIVHHLNPHRS